MPITREDVRRNINFTDMARTQKSSAKPAPAPDRGAMPTNGAPNLRTRNKHVGPKDLIRLDRLTSAEFDNMLGEGSDPSCQIDKKKLGDQKKVEANLKLDNMCAINSQIVKENSVRDNMEQEHGQSSSPTTHPDENELEATLPLGHPNLGKDDNALGSEAVPEPPTEKTIVEPTPVNNQLIVEKCMDREVQTEPVVIVICSCPRCEAFFDAMKLLLKSAETNECQFLKTPEETSKSLSTSFGALFTATSDNIKRDTPLYKGSTILLTSTDKSMLKDLNPQDDDPKEFVTMIMDGIYTAEEMANMSAMGRTPGSTPMDPTVFKQIFAYLRHKYKEIEDVDITKSTVVALVNAKCYAMRRQCWEKIRKTEVHSDGTPRNLVRKPLPKKVKDPNKPCLSRQKNKRRQTDESLPPLNKKRKNTSSGESKTASCDESATKKNKEVKKPRKISQDSSDIRDRKSEKNNSTKEMRSENLHKKEVKEREKTIKAKRSEKNSRTKDMSTRKEVSSDGHKGGKLVNRMFKSDASKHHWLSPKKGNSRGRGMSPSPKKSNIRVHGSDSSPVIFNSRQVVKPTMAENKMHTSTPRFGGKRPKSMEELAKVINQSDEHENSDEDEEEEEGEDDDELVDENEDDDAEQDFVMSDHSGVEYIYGSSESGEDLMTD